MTTTARFTKKSVDDDEGLTPEELAAKNAQKAVKLKIALSCLSSYFVIGWIAFLFIFEMKDVHGKPGVFTFTDCTYFLMVTLMTVGYGEIVPANQAARLFMSVFVFFGISIVCVSLIEVANWFIEKREAVLKKTRAEVVRKAANDVKKGTAPPALAPPSHFSPIALANSIMEKWPIIPLILNLVVYAVVFGLLFRYIEADQHWTVWDGIYFTIITGSTVGYGDVVPKSVGGRWAAVFFLPVAVIFVSTKLSQAANILLGKSEDNKMKELLNADLSIEALLSMDTNGDGEITEFEFIKFMMATAGMVDEDTLDSLYQRFKEMDVDGNGCLTPEDIALMQRKKRGSTSKEGARP